MTVNGIPGDLNDSDDRGTPWQDFSHTHCIRNDALCQHISAVWYCPHLKRMSDVSLPGHGVSEAIPPFFAVPLTERLPRSRWSLAMTAPHKFPSLPTCESELGHYPILAYVVGTA